MNATTETTAQAFFYIDGIPTKGLWVDLDDVTGWEDVEAKLLDLFPSSQADEILCADVEGLARFFYDSRMDYFDLKEYLEFKEEIEGSYLDIEVIEAYLDNMGSASGVKLSDIEEAYQGQWSSDEDFAEELLDSTGGLEGMDESLKCYFDYSAFARDLMYDYFESNGYYFRNL